MDQPTPDPSSPPAPSRESRAAQRLQSLVDEPLVAWTQGYVSRDLRLHDLLAARTYDFAVVTEHSFHLVSTGFFSRRPRRRVFDAVLREMTVTKQPAPRGRTFRLEFAESRPLRLELRDREKTAAFTAALISRTQAGRKQ